jgi:hypothetical protein
MILNILMVDLRTVDIEENEQQGNALPIFFMRRIFDLNSPAPSLVTAGVCSTRPFFGEEQPQVFSAFRRAHTFHPFF